MSNRDDDRSRRAALDRVIELVVLFNEDMTRSLARDGLTVSRAGVVWTLRQRGPSTQRVLADALGVSARTVTGLVDGLVDTGFVTRQPHPTDRRAILVTLTPHGERIAERLDRDQGELAGQLFGDMPPRRFAAFTAGLDDVVTTLHRLIGEVR